MIRRLARFSVSTLGDSFNRPSHFLGVFILWIVVLAALFGPLSGYEIGADVDLTVRNSGPSLDHFLGTDHLGRDVFWRLVLACRAFVWPGLLACVVATVLAVPAGAIAGYNGGFVEAVLRYGFTVVASLPRFVLVLLVCAIYGNSMWKLALAAGVAYAPTLGEAVFSRIESLRNAEYIIANRAYGLPTWRILWIHLVWAACGRLIGRHLLNLFGYFLVLETTLSYLEGFGVQEPDPSWGNMLVFEWGQGSGFGIGVIAPAFAIWITIAATTWLSHALQEPGDA